MDIDITSVDSIQLAAVSGEFNLGEEEQIANELQPLVADADSRLAIDLSDLKQINSQGLSELINVVIRARMSRSRVVLVAPSPFVMGVFDVTHLNEWFEIVDDFETAQETLRV